MLLQVFCFLLATSLAVTIASRLGLGSVIGYLIAGAVIGPHALKLLAESGDMSEFAEFGINIMLFLVGLELLPSTLWKLRVPIFGTGAVQVLGTTAVFTVASMLLGFPWQTSLVIGCALCLSSTAIVLQSLKEKGLMATNGGQTSFAVLLFQDIAVIPMIAIFPFLSLRPKGMPMIPGSEGETGFIGWLHRLPAWGQALAVILAVVMVVVASRFILPKVFRFVADSHLQELFTATTLAIVLGVAQLMQVVGLSPALGTFLAGIVLAESPFRKQIETDLEPFKGLLLGLFFVGVGASIDLQLIYMNPLKAVGILTGFLVLKIITLLIVGRLFKMRGSQNVIFSFVMSQGDEFAFVLLEYGAVVGALSHDIKDWLIATVALSMATTPFLMAFQSRFIQPYFSQVNPSKHREPDVVEERNPVILAGFGRVGHIVGRMLRLNGVGTTVLDHDADQIEILGRFGMKAYFGDATRLDLLRKAGIEEAKLLIVAIDHEEGILEMVDTVQKHFPHVHIIARAEHKLHAYDLARKGVRSIHRSTLGTALEMGRDALTFMGLEQERIARAVKSFQTYEATAVAKFSQIDRSKLNETEYTSLVRKHLKTLEDAFKEDPIPAPTAPHIW